VKGVFRKADGDGGTGRRRPETTWKPVGPAAPGGAGSVMCRSRSSRGPHVVVVFNSLPRAAGRLQEEEEEEEDLANGPPGNCPRSVRHGSSSTLSGNILALLLSYRMSV
jgi:hypothetical protein